MSQIQKWAEIQKLKFDDYVKAKQNVRFYGWVSIPLMPLAVFWIYCLSIYQDPYEYIGKIFYVMDFTLLILSIIICISLALIVRYLSLNLKAAVPWYSRRYIATVKTQLLQFQGYNSDLLKNGIITQRLDDEFRLHNTILKSLVQAELTLEFYSQDDIPALRNQVVAYNCNLEANKARIIQLLETDFISPKDKWYCYLTLNSGYLEVIKDLEVILAKKQHFYYKNVATI